MIILKCFDFNPIQSESMLLYLYVAPVLNIAIHEFKFQISNGVFVPKMILS